jgi:methionine biosynthesis protein MetW
MHSRRIRQSVCTAPDRSHDVIIEWVQQGSSVLDLGCGDGTLLRRLHRERGTTGCGIEIDEEQVCRAVEQGVSVLHGDIDSGLPDYADRSFAYVILNQSLQQVRHVETVLNEALRVGRRVIVGFPNFAYLPARLQLFFGGRVPVTGSLPYAWYDTPNLHFLSIKDFVEYCRTRGIAVERAAYIAGNRRIRLLPNLRADSGLFMLHRPSEETSHGSMV